MFKHTNFSIFFFSSSDEFYYKQPRYAWLHLCKIVMFYSIMSIALMILLRCLWMANTLDLSLMVFADNSVSETLDEMSSNASLNNYPILGPEYYKPRTYVPKNQLERDVLKTWYKGGVDPLFARVFEVFSTNQSYLVFWYLSYNGNFDFLKGQMDFLTETTMVELCLKYISPKYMANMAIAGVANFEEFSPEWLPPHGYIESPPWHPWLAHGPNFVGWVPWEYVHQTVEAAKAVEGSATDFVNKVEELRKAKFYLPVNFQENFALYHQLDSKKFEISDKLRHIFTTNLKYLLYEYIVYNDSVLRKSPIWSEEALFKACLELPANYIFEVCEVGKLHFQEYSNFWQPPADYLKTKPFRQWFTLLPDFTGPIPTTDIFSGRTPYEKGLIDAFYTKAKNREHFRELYHIFTSNLSYLVYTYAAFHDVVLHNGPWLESDIHQVCLKLDPQLILDIVNAGKSTIPGFSKAWYPSPFCLQLNLYQEWFQYGPWVWPYRMYMFFAVIFFIAIWVPIKLAGQDDFND